MAKLYALYNPTSGGGAGFPTSGKLEIFFENDEIEYVDVTSLNSYQSFFAALQADERVVLCGGDGTINYFANAFRGCELEHGLYYYPTGTGNDFWCDLGKDASSAPILLNDYLKNLPTVTIDGKESLFFNGVGYGIDGYCCEEGDKERAKSDKPVNYAAIAIKGILFDFKPRSAVITVDGKEYIYKKVWIAATMHGRCYGGGMIAAPDQVRNNADGTVSVFVWHSSGKLPTLMAFPSIFKGEHVKKTNMITIITGKEINVKFNAPTPCQIDGETVTGVSEYSVKAGR